MTLTIRDAFDLLFAVGSLPDSGSPKRPNLQSRRWFRRPSPGVIAVAPDKANVDVAKADEILHQKVRGCMATWKRTALRESSRGGRTRWKFDAKRDFDPLRDIPLRMPYDVFAMAGFLVETAGIYHHVQPEKVLHGKSGTAAFREGPHHIAISQRDRDLVLETAKVWAGLELIQGDMASFATLLTSDDVWAGLQPLFESWWIVFAGCGGESIYPPADSDTNGAPVWWKHVWRLFAIADEAAKGTAFQFDVGEMHNALNGKPTGIRWFEFDVLVEHIQRALSESSAAKAAKNDASEFVEFADITTLSVASDSVLSVLPKVRTPAVGCTLRSLSHHLALLPAAGVAKGRWTPNYLRPQLRSGSMPEGLLNLVLVPLPYSLEANSFSAALIEKVDGDKAGVPRFGYFEVHQHWLPENPARTSNIVSFIQDLIETAQKQCSAIHGIVFPELSLDYDTFAIIREHLRKTLPDTDILVSGLATDATGRRGNFVAVASFQAGATARADREYRETIREKHHRWKLERAQLKDYGLQGVLSPELSWWENIALQTRKVDFTVMRRDSVFAAMICEDLARVDPCQQIIRSVGPNLVVALLMDAPQIAARWPARYATVLAEDPGCAVLTLTSRGLMTRQHRLGTYRSNGDDRVVGMWRDDRNAGPIELKCPYDAQAVLLTIVEEAAEDISLDGRSDRGAKAWRYSGDVPLRVPDVREKHAAILGDEDRACW